MIIAFIAMAAICIWMSQNYTITAHASDKNKEVMAYHVVATVLIVIACTLLVWAGAL